jgi:hypothetical protein
VTHYYNNLNTDFSQFFKSVAATTVLLLQPYADCKKWKEDVESEGDTTKEMEKFEDGSLMTTLLGTVSRRLGFEKTLEIGMYTLQHEVHNQTEGMFESGHMFAFLMEPKPYSVSKGPTTKVILIHQVSVP